ncbi:MAG: hypothetical protein JNK49_10350 [Planctomycetes bacterium]|nr:hypothetical protein [Planctomycetota bacterium]
MHPPTLGSCLLATLVVAASLLPAQQPTAPHRAVSPRVPIAPPVARDHVCLDAHGDGTVWARGTDWKASFGASGFVFVPFLGADAPRNFPVTVRLQSVRAGSVALPLDLSRAATVAGNTVRMARGAVTECYELATRGVEQKFVVAERPVAGNLTVELAVDTELTAAGHADGTLTFANERGGVRVSEAIAIDAGGRRCHVQAELVADGYTLTVPADFLAAAAFPLVIDPFFLSFSITPGPGSTLYQLPDVAYLAQGDGFYASVFEEIYSATDHDVLVGLTRRDGSSAGFYYVDVSTTTWLAPRVASHLAASQFLCVARVGNTSIGARTIQLAASGSSAVLSLGLPFTIRASATAMDADVGGDSNRTAALPGNYCVTWGESGNVRHALVRTDSLVLVPPNPVLDPVGASAGNPAISKCCGPALPGAQDWMIVWEQDAGANGQDIWGASVHFDGSLSAPAFLIEGANSSDTRPEVSSLTDVFGNVQQWMVVWQRAVPGGPLQPAHDDVWGAIWDGTTPRTGPRNLTALLLRPNFRNQWNPCVETDGMRFCVGFAEKVSTFSPDVEPYLATVHLQGGATMEVTSYPELLNAYVEADDNLQIASERSGGTASTRYMTVWDTRQPSPLLQGCIGAFYRGHLNVPSASYFNHALPGCGAMTLVPSGLPALGETIQMNLVGAQGLPFLFAGFSVPPTSYCGGCELGVDQATAAVLFTNAFTLAIPPDVGLIGLMLAFQGIDVLAPGGCSAPVPFTLTDEIIVLIL